MNQKDYSNISRRQLFGGRRQTRPTTMGQGGRPIEPTEPMTASPGLNLDDLPPVHRATLTADQVRDLFRELATEATAIRLSSSAAASSPEILARAGESLLTHGIKRLQMRYAWQGKFWIDTLDQTAEGIRLVRIAHDHPV